MMLKEKTSINDMASSFFKMRNYRMANIEIFLNKNAQMLYLFTNGISILSDGLRVASEDMTLTPDSIA